MSKEIYFLSSYKYIQAGNVKDTFNYTNSLGSTGLGLLKTIKIIINGKNRTDITDYQYYNYLNPNKYHSKNPSEGLNSFSFSLFPENKQPSGSCNFSKIDDITFIFSTKSDVTYLNPGLIRIYSNYYNVLRIKDGLCGIAFSN